ncbi:FHA domain-containing protein FhaB/FipA [Mycetocola reblochoni]|uniref:FHA-domain-containing proteins n=2 Tax=Mycetocola reblochoni TaxID=331618 RepID=A0A1R4JG67_9MICO|nr:FHA domain-containing protein [Mycetocola reblochoni]SJN30934.1 FHA-domain-containing proteins [Mycetocola reblochoni REB411]
MSTLTLLVMKIGFLVLLWFFVFAIVYSLRTELFGLKARKGQQATAAAPAPAPAAKRKPSTAPQPPEGSATSATASTLVIVAGTRAGERIPLGREPITIGRSSDSTLVLKDDYTSTHHARLVLWNDGWMIQDLDSTNGTFLNGKRISSPTPVPLGVPVKVGATSFELRH